MRKKKHSKQSNSPGMDIPDSLLIRAIKKLPLLMLTGLVVLTVSLFYSWWIFDIISSFTPQALMILMGGYLILGSLYLRFLIRDGWKVCRLTINKFDRTALAVLIGLTGYVFVFSLTQTPRIPTAHLAEGLELKITTFNKLEENTEAEKIVAHFVQQQPDIIGLQEIRSGEVDLIRDSLGLPYSIVSDCDCSAKDSEIALISRYPIGDITSIEDENLGIIAANVDLGDWGEIRVYVVHVPPPRQAYAYEIRNKALEALPTIVSSFPEPAIIMGDFNTAVYSPQMRKLVSGLKSKGILQASTRAWPHCSWDLYSSALCARIDHVFVPDNYKLIKQTISDNLGSDHRAITTTVDVN